MITKNICTKNEEGRINGSFRVCELDYSDTTGDGDLKVHCVADVYRAKLVKFKSYVIKDTRNAAQKEACKK